MATTKEKEQLYYPSENVSQFYEEATRDYFFQWFIECTDWYDNAVQNGEFDGTIEEYAEMLFETELSEVDD